MCIPFVKKCLLTMNSLPLLFFFKQCTITFTLISVDRVILLLKAHLLGVTRGVLYSRNVASFIFVDVINLLEITTGFTILFQF